MVNRNSILNKFFSGNLLFYSYLFLKRYLYSSFFLKNIDFYPISFVWFKKVTYLVSFSRFNYGVFRSHFTSTIKFNKKNLKFLKIRVIEISFLFLLVPYFPFMFFNSISLSNLVCI